MVCLQYLDLAFQIPHLYFQGLAFDQERLPHFERDDRMGNALGATEKKSRPLLGVMRAHPFFEIEVANRQVRRFPQGFVRLRDAVSAIRNITVENRIVDALGVKLKFRPAWAIYFFEGICRRRYSTQNFRLVFQRACPPDGCFDGAIEHFGNLGVVAHNSISWEPRQCSFLT
jgi:hypothetical protein